MRRGADTGHHREPLEVTGETIWRVDPLEPEDSYRVFVERARQRRPDFVPGANTARLLVAGPADPGTRVITIWDSNEARERFISERLSKAYDEAGLSLDRGNMTVFEVSKLAAGDLTGAPQPA